MHPGRNEWLTSPHIVKLCWGFQHVASRGGLSCASCWAIKENVLHPQTFKNKTKLQVTSCRSFCMGAVFAIAMSVEWTGSVFAISQSSMSGIYDWSQRYDELTTTLRTLLLRHLTEIGEISTSVAFTVNACWITEVMGANPALFGHFELVLFK